MELGYAQSLAEEVVTILKPFCFQLDGQVLIKVAGSIRRRRPFPRDIDIVLVPATQPCRALGNVSAADQRLRSGFTRGCS